MTDEDSVQAAVEQILLERGSIEILVNCAGFGISGAVEFTELKQAKAQFDVNFFGKRLIKRLHSGLDTKRKMAGCQLWSHFDRYEKQFH